MLENISVKMGNYGEYLDLPTYRVKVKDANGRVETDENGREKFECKDMFHPITAEAQSELKNSVVMSLKAVKQERARAAENEQSQSQYYEQNQNTGRRR
jgi:DNA-binding cell septation regulator SpoVG